MFGKLARLTTLVVCSCAVGCAGCNDDGVRQLPPGQTSDGMLLALGDSVLDWNRSVKGSIPEVAGATGKLEVLNAAISGAVVLGEDDEAIPNQYRSGRWAWVLIDGGANDLGGTCGCNDCREVLDAIIDDEGNGAMVRLVDRIRSDGARVVLLGYYRGLEGTEFGPCLDEIDVLDGRYAAFAARREGVFFFDMGSVLDPKADPGLLDEDRVHPSARGGELVGRAVGALIAAQSE